MASNNKKAPMPLYRRLEYSSVGVILGSLVLLGWGVLGHSDSSVSAGISALSIAVMCLIVLRLAGWSRARQTR